MPNSREGRHRGAELPFPAVDEQDVGEEFQLVREPLKAPRDNFVDAGEVIDAGDRPNLEPLVAGLERQPVDEPHEAGDRFAAGQMGNIDPFDRPRRLGEMKHLPQPGETFLRIDVKDLGLGMLVEIAALVERFEHVDFVA